MTIPVINQGSLPLATINADAFSNIAGGNLAQNSQVTIWNPSNSVRTSSVRVATFGDSTANAANIAQQDLTAYNPAFPGSGATSLVVAPEKFALPMFYSQAFLVGNGGVSGETTTQMLARDSAAAGINRKATQDIVNLRPDVVLLRGGSINDILTVTNATLLSTVAAVYARHIQLVARLSAGGAIVIDEGIYGFTNGTAATAADQAATRAAIVRLNGLFAAYAATLPGRVYFLSPVNVVSDSSGAYLNAMSADGVHLSQWGGYVMGAAEATLMRAIFGIAVGPRFRGTNVIVNAMMDTTGLQSWGTVATGFSVSATNAVRQNAKIEIIDGKPWQTFEIVPNGTGSPIGLINMPYDPSSASTVSPMGIVANDVWGFEFDFSIKGLNGGAAPLATSILGRVDTFKTAAGRVVWDNLAPNLFSSFLGEYTGKCVIGPWMITEASASLTNSSIFIIQFQTADQVTSFKMGVSQPRIVKLGTAVTLT